MKIHVLGISGTFMSALSILAREAGYEVSGCDAHCYPPVSDLLRDKGITWLEGYEHVDAALSADEVVVGNAMKRGIPVVEAVLNNKHPYTSGPEWLARHVLSNYRVIAIAGTHGKTTTTSMVAWILDQAGKEPGFLIGGVAPNFNTSARLGKGEWFVIEADEYDSAFFDKRPKFMHYRPEIAILNNLEFDHADIYADLPAIQLQFHYLLRMIPGQGVALKPKNDKALNEVVARGMYSRLEDLSVGEDATWTAKILDDSASTFAIYHDGQQVAEVNWPLIGRFNVENALAAIAACFHAGVTPDVAANALQRFKPVKRRLENRGEQQGITVYDDFAHHPTAIAKTLHALKQSKRHQRIIAIMEFASYTMRTGVHAHQMGQALSDADFAFILEPEAFHLEDLNGQWAIPVKSCQSTEDIIQSVLEIAKPGDALLVMSNRGFNGIHQALLDALKTIPCT